MSSQTTPTKLSLLPAQKELWLAQDPIVAFVAGFGGGKTDGGVKKALKLGLQNPPDCVGLYIEPTYPMVRDIAIRSFEQVYKAHGIPYKLHRTEHWMRVADRFDILFRSGDQPENLVGINASWAIIDEPSDQDEDVAKMVLSRVRDPRATVKQLILTGTPKGYNWFHRWATNKGTRLIRAKSTDNPFLDPGYIARMREMYTEEEVQSYINGEFVRMEGGWYKKRPMVLGHEDAFGFKVYRAPDVTSGQIVIGVDSAGGVGRDSSAISVVDKKDKGLCASWVSETSGVDFLCEQVQRIWQYYTTEVGCPEVVVEVNGIGRYTFQILSGRLGVPCIEINTTEAKRYRFLLLARNAVHDGKVKGPSELDREAQNLVVDGGRFKGPKDLSMSIGFALAQIEDSPFRPNRPRMGNVVSFNKAIQVKTRF